MASLPRVNGFMQLLMMRLSVSPRPFLLGLKQVIVIVLATQSILIVFHNQVKL